MALKKDIDNIIYYAGWLRQGEAREYLGGVSYPKFKEYVVKGLPERIIGGVYLYHPKEIDEFVERMERQG